MEKKCPYCKNGSILIKENHNSNILCAVVTLGFDDGSTRSEYCTNCNYIKEI